jgi:hypothetical protein
MGLSNCDLICWLRLKARCEASNGQVGMDLRNLLNCCNGYVDIWSGLTTRMLRGSPMAITRHLLAAFHFRRGHLAVWQTGKCRRECPQKQPTHNQNGADFRH